MKLSLKPITTQIWAPRKMLSDATKSSFSGSLTVLNIRDTLELLRRNPHLTPLRPNTWQIWKMLSDACNHRFQVCL